MSHPQQAEAVFSRPDAIPHPESAATSGVSTPNFTSKRHQARGAVLKFLAAAGISMGLLSQGCGGSDDGPYSLGDGGSDAGMNVCGDNCGSGTHCDEATKHCVPDTNNDPCDNLCGKGTVCNPDTKKCDPVSHDTFAGVTWQNAHAGSGNGWIETINNGGANYPLGNTVWFHQTETPATVCFVGYGSGTILTMNGSGEWWDVESNFLAAQTGHSPGDLAYLTSQQAAKDAAGQLISYRTTPQQYRPANAFVWRAAGSNQSWQENDPIADTDVAIHCADVPSDGIVETH